MSPSSFKHLAAPRSAKSRFSSILNIPPRNADDKTRRRRGKPPQKAEKGIYPGAADKTYLFPAKKQKHIQDKSVEGGNGKQNAQNKPKTKQKKLGIIRKSPNRPYSIQKQIDEAHGQKEKHRPV
jgi:hypothetical protein